MKAVEKIDTKMVLKAAKKYIKLNDIIKIVLYPEDMKN